MQTVSASRKGSAVDMLSLMIGGTALACGLPMLFFPREERLVAEAKVLARKAELAAGADEHFFEERRSLEAYPPPKTDRKWRIKGAFLTTSGVALLLLSFFR